MESASTLYGFLVKGGPVMYPLGLCSIAVLAIFFERMLSLRRNRIIPKNFLIEIEDLIRRDKIPEAMILCKTNRSSIANIFFAGISHYHLDRQVIREMIEDVGRREGAQLASYLNVLAAIASVSPLLGLLGTVIGLLQVFRIIESQGAGSTAIFAGGIYQALITTVVGLSIAIPTFLLHKYFESKVERLVLDMEEASLTVLDMVPLRE